MVGNSAKKFDCTDIFVSMARGWRGRGRGRGRGGRGRGGRRNSSQEGSQQGGYGYSQVPNTPLDQQGNPQINASSFAEMRAAHCTEQCPGWSRYFPSEIFADDFPYLPQVVSEGNRKGIYIYKNNNNNVHSIYI